LSEASLEDVPDLEKPKLEDFVGEEKVGEPEDIVLEDIQPLNEGWGDDEDLLEIDI
jgi:hypothetical protein